MMIESALFRRDDLADLLALVAANGRHRLPGATYRLNSDIAWQLPGSRGNLMLWRDQHGLAAYAWFSLITGSTFDLRSDIALDSGLPDQVLGWLESRRRQFKPLVPWLLELKSMAQWEAALDSGRPGMAGDERVLLLEVFDGDAPRIEFLTRHGFERTEHFGYYLHRDFSAPIPPLDLPDGWSLRHVRPEDFERRVKVHRDAWHRSSFSMEQYLSVRSIEAYDPELDLVVETPDGEFASYAIGWVDPVLKVGSFEPVGTPPRFRRRGLGQQVQHEGLRRMQAKGMTLAKIGTAGFNDRAFGLYSSCGFSEVDRLRTYAKTLR